MKKVEIVPSGSFATGRRQPRRLQALLGSCVGVAVTDTRRGVGGLAHFLLPEPLSVTAAAPAPERYASTGLPLFLDALAALGAQIADMRATVAGGALVGAVGAGDLEMDLGGRITETVLAGLQRHGVRVEHSETGGFFTCCLELDLSTGTCAITPVGARDTPPDDAEPEDLPDRDRIQHTMDTLAPIPQVALKILRLMGGGEVERGAIAAELRRDQVLTARTLRVSNSALFARRAKIVSLDHALSFLGETMVVKLVISACLQQVVAGADHGYSLCRGGLYHHAVGCAHIAEGLARASRSGDPAWAYTAALLHDIGKVVLDQHVAKVYPLFYREVMARRDSRRAEQALFGVDHTAIGGRLARRWGFPADLIDPLAHHHTPDRAAGDARLTHLVAAADLLMTRFNPALEMEVFHRADLNSHLGALGLAPDCLAEVVDRIPPAIFNLPEAVPDGAAAA